MKKLLTGLFVTFLFCFSAFASEELMNLNMVFPARADDPFCLDETVYGGMVDLKHMRNDVWGFEAGGYLAFTEPAGSKKYSRMDVNAYIGLPIRIFKNRTFDVFMSPVGGLDFTMDTNFSQSSDNTITYLWVGGNFDVNLKISSSLYLNGGVFLEYYLYSTTLNYDEACRTLYIIPKAGLTLVL